MKEKEKQKQVKSRGRCEEKELLKQNKKKK